MSPTSSGRIGIEVIGASGHLGAAVAREALSRRHEVTATARDASRLRELDGARATAADVLATDAMTGALAAHHALEILRDADGAVDWSYAGLLPMHLVDGDRKGRYRVRAGDLPITDARGERRVSVGDHAAAIVHVPASARVIHERFTAAYR
jgi:putative NADH-flavin reductase